MRRTSAVVAMAVATASLGLVGGASAARVYRQVRYVRLVATSGFYVDNDPSGASGGDLFGATGVLRHHRHQVATFSDACTASSAEGGQCQTTLTWNSGDRLELAGEIRPRGVKNRLSILGGTGKYKQARGDASLTRLDDQGSVQRIRLVILR